MAKFGTGKLYATGILYGASPQYLVGAGNIPSAAALGSPTVNPGPVTIWGVGNIPTEEAWGTPCIFLVPQGLVLSINSRRLLVCPQRRYLGAVPHLTHLQVTPDA